jgi:hypothetical protein
VYSFLTKLRFNSLGQLKHSSELIVPINQCLYAQQKEYTSPKEEEWLENEGIAEIGTSRKPPGIVVSAFAEQ